MDKNKDPIRPFTLFENAKLQTYPTEYFKIASEMFTKTELMHMVANSVSPEFAGIFAIGIHDLS